MVNSINKICCIGAGYVGGPTMAVIAKKCPAINIYVVDINEERISRWNHSDINQIPVFEPELSEIIGETRDRNLFFSTDIKQHIGNSDMVFISVNTPTKEKGVGAGEASDLKWVEACARQIAEFSQNHTIVVEKSTMPVRTAEVIKEILFSSNKKNKNATFSILSNPEFLAEGTAIRDLEYPDRVLIGGDDPKALDALSEIYENWIDKAKIIRTNLWSSELSKLAANAFLAQRISSINSIGAFCEATGANIAEVSNAIGMDARIGKMFLKTGPGYGGSCFKKDLLNLVYLSKYFGLPEVAEYWDSVNKLNEWQKNRISKIIVNKLFGTISSKKIAIFGFSFKANTNDTRESSAIKIAKDLLEEGAFLMIHDPKVSAQQIEKDLQIKESKHIELNDKKYGHWVFTNSTKEAIKNADAVLILTDWDEYKNIKWKEYSSFMRKPSWIFDCRNLINKELFDNDDTKLWIIGDGTVDNKISYQD